MIKDEDRNRRIDAQKDMRAALDSLSRALRRLKHTGHTSEMLMAVMEGVVEVMEFNASVAEAE